MGGLLISAPRATAEYASSEASTLVCYRRVAGLVFYLGKACRQLRRERRIKLVRVGARLDKGESSLSRFERGEVQPDYLDQTLESYAEELEVTVADICEVALSFMQEAENPS